jgi:hypothetical protein
MTDSKTAWKDVSYRCSADVLEVAVLPWGCWKNTAHAIRYHGLPRPRVALALEFGTRSAAWP